MGFDGDELADAHVGQRSGNTRIVGMMWKGKVWYRAADKHERDLPIWWSEEKGIFETGGSKGG